MTSFKSSLSWMNCKLDSQIKYITSNINSKIGKLTKKIDNLSEIFKETLLFSNKTHYMEEVSKLRIEK